MNSKKRLGFNFLNENFYGIILGFSQGFYPVIIEQEQ